MHADEKEAFVLRQSTLSTPPGPAALLAALFIDRSRDIIGQLERAGTN